MALGAQARDVVGLVLRSTTRVVATGLGIGLLGAFGLSRMLGAVLPGMATDTTVVGVIAGAVLIAAAFLACYLPARRATLVGSDGRAADQLKVTTRAGARPPVDRRSTGRSSTCRCRPRCHRSRVMPMRSRRCSDDRGSASEPCPAA